MHLCYKHCSVGLIIEDRSSKKRNPGELHSGFALQIMEICRIFMQETFQVGSFIIGRGHLVECRVIQLGKAVWTIMSDCYLSTPLSRSRTVFQTKAMWITNWFLYRNYFEECSKPKWCTFIQFVETCVGNNVSVGYLSSVKPFINPEQLVTMHLNQLAGISVSNIVRLLLVRFPNWLEIASSKWVGKPD